MSIQALPRNVLPSSSPRRDPFARKSATSRGGILRWWTLLPIMAAIGCGAGGPADVTCVRGDFVINRTDELEALTRTRCVEGNLVLNVPDIDSISAPSLERVDGDLVVIETGAPVLLLPALTEVTGSILIQVNPLLSAIQLNALPEIGGDLVVNGNPLLTTLSASILENVSGDVTVGGNPSLGNVDFQNLSQTDGSLSFVLNDALVILALDAVEDVGGSLVFEQLGATSVAMPNLRAVERSLVFSQVPVTDISLPDLEQIGGSLQINNCPVTTIDIGSSAELRTVELAQLYELESLNFLNGKLSTTMDTIALSNLSAAEFEGTFVDVESVLGALALSDVGVISDIDFSALTRAGSISIYQPSARLRDADFRRLTTVDASLQLNGYHSVRLDALTDVGGLLNLRAYDSFNNQWVPFTLPALKTVGGQVNVQPFPSTGLPLLETAGSIDAYQVVFGGPLYSMPALTSVGRLNVTGAPSDLTIPLLEEAGTIYFSGFDGEIFADALTTVGSLIIESAGSPPHFNAPLLERVETFSVGYGRAPTGLVLTSTDNLFLAGITGEEVEIAANFNTIRFGRIDNITGGPIVFPNLAEATDGLQLTWCQDATEIAFPALTTVGGSGLTMQNFQELETLDLSALETVTSFYFNTNGAFDVCSLEAVQAQLLDNGTDPDTIYIPGIETCN